MKYKSTKDEKIDFILRYLKNKYNRYTINVLDSDFMWSYIEEFNLKYAKWQPFGAPTCEEVGKLLSDMYKQNLLDRYIIGLSGMESGFPKWIYCYELSNASKRMLEGL